MGRFPDPEVIAPIILRDYSSSMDDDLTWYELDVLLWHRDKPHQESQDADRREAQKMLAGLRYLTRSDEGVFSITSKGLKRVGKGK